MQSVRLALSATLLALASPVLAQDQITAEQFEAQLQYQTGRIALKNGLATLDVPQTFRYLDGESAQRVIEGPWGNPPGSAEGVLGMLVPAGISPLADEGWGVVITFDEDGWVDDKDASSIDYAELLASMQKDTRASNEARRREGYEPVSLVGWAEPPSYSRETNKMYWAKELQFGEGPEATRTLNYNVRVLGRRGVLVLNAVAGMQLLPSIRTDMQKVISFVEFNEGHRYADYQPGTDKAAAYGIAGLVAGTVAMKAGFFKVLLAGLLAAKKLIVVGLVAAGAAIKRFFGGGKSEG
jgi:uncharacterized membrane-anchored protein